jgi:hypothetical protein
VFWGAKEDAPLYAGPLGEVVGTVPRGSVLLETSRYHDPFGGWWISTRCSDGSLGWIEYGEESRVTAAAVASVDALSAAVSAVLWQRVYDTRATPASPATNTPAAAAGRGSGLPGATLDETAVLPHVEVAAISELESQHFLFQDASLFEYFWDCVFVAGKQRNWNAEYQRVLEMYRMAPQLALASNDSDSAAAAASRERMVELVNDFREAVEAAVVKVCAEAVVPLAQRHVCSLPEHPNEVFYVDGILIKRCVDSANGVLGGDELACKVGNAAYRNAEIVALEAPSHFLYTPLQARCTFAGYAFLCSTIPPYGRRNLICVSPYPFKAATERTKSTPSATSGAANTDSHLRGAAQASPPVLVQDLLRSLGEALRFQDGEVPWEWRVYAGRDRRLYLAQTTRLLPPVLPLAPDIGSNREHSSASSRVTDTAASVVVAAQENDRKDTDLRLYPRLLRSRVRPEIFYNWPTQWRVNEWCTSESDGAQRRTTLAASPSKAVGQWIKGDGITQVAGVLGFHLPLSAPPMPTGRCNACGNTIDSNEVRFVACTSPLQCCHVCVQCYTRLLAGSDGAVDSHPDERLSRICADAVKCGAGCRKAACCIMEPSVTTIMHAQGLNMRYLPFVLHRLPVATRPVVEQFLYVELVARAAKYVLQQELRRTTTGQEARNACETVLSALLQPAGTASERFWRTRLGPALQAHFDGICEPFQLSVHALRAVAERVQTLTGIRLSDLSLESLEALSMSDHHIAATSEGGETVIKGKTRTSDTRGSSDVEDAAAARAFVEVVAIVPRTWVFPVTPLHVPSAGEAATKKEGSAPPLRRRLEAMLLFWIGHTPDNADDLQQPFYLDESIFHNTT